MSDAQSRSPVAPAVDLPKGRLLRVLGAGFGIAVALGSSIGAGIMRTPAGVTAHLPSAPLIMLAWTIGGAYSLIGAWSLSEVGAMVPSAGAYHAIARRAYGDYISFVVGWTDWISVCEAIAFITLAAGEYPGDLVPAFAGHDAALAALLVLMLGLMQWRGIRWGSVFQDITSAITAFVFALLMVAAFAHPHAHFTSEPRLAMPEGIARFGAWVLVLRSVIGTYDGWYAALYFGDEIVNPGIELPRSLIRGVVLLSVIYVLINAALLYSMNLTQLSRENLPLAQLGQVLGGARGIIAIRWLMALILVPCANAALLAATRVLFAMSRDGWGPARIATVNAGGTPSIPLLLSVIAGLVFLLSGSFDRVLAVTAFFFLAKYLLSYLSVFVLRRREPGASRPYRTLGYPWTTAVAVLASLLYLGAVATADRRNTFYGFVVLLASYQFIAWYDELFQMLQRTAFKKYLRQHCEESHGLPRKQ